MSTDPYRTALAALVAELDTEQARTYTDHARIVTRGPRKGCNAWNRAYYHGYHDALQDARIMVADRLAELDRAELTPAGPTPEQIANAVRAFQAELTANAPALARVLDAYDPERDR